MDDDPVLRSLGAELERDDPELAALLTGTAPGSASQPLPDPPPRPAPERRPPAHRPPSYPAPGPWLLPAVLCWPCPC